MSDRPAAGQHGSVFIEEQMFDSDWAALRNDAELNFTPGTPIRERDLFAGRSPQINKLNQRIRMAGSHAVIYGERGVGKSSLVNVFRQIAASIPDRIQYIRIAVTEGDDFTKVMTKVFKRMTAKDNDGTEYRLSDRYEGKEITPDDVLLEMENFRASATPIVVIDEFDKLADDFSSSLVSSTIKLLSDEGSNVTFFIVGVSDAVNQLIHGHESLGSPIAEIEMPRMEDKEIIDVIHKRVSQMGTTMSESAIWDCVFLCKGLPYYAHLVGLHSVQAACDRHSLKIDRDDVAKATERSISGANQSIKEAYEAAIYSERTTNIFQEVLVACALSEKDPLGRFSAKSVSTRLKQITGKAYDQPQFAYHLKEFCSDSRGNLLERFGAQRQFRFRFREALTEAFVVLQGKQAGIITDEFVKKYGPKRQADLFSDELPVTQ